jgi:hypothetical protein
MKNKNKYIVWGFLLSLLLLSGCANGVHVTTTPYMEPVGFWWGLLHGVIVPFSFIGSLFSEDIAIYAVYNNGGWYDFGFCLGAGALFGGSR